MDTPSPVNRRRNTYDLTTRMDGGYRVILGHTRLNLPPRKGTYRTAYGARMALRAMRVDYARLADEWDSLRAWAKLAETLG